MKVFYPMLLTKMKSYTKEQLLKDVIAGIIVAIIALPLSIALALASGVGPEQGLYTAIVAGLLIALFGGSSVQIAGPTAAFATIVAGIVATSGMSGLIVATILAGFLLIIMGLCRFGSLIKFIPYTITTGFTGGIAVTILIGQLKDFFGLTYPHGFSAIETMDKLGAVITHFATINTMALLVGLVCLVILILWPRVSKMIPGSIVAVVVSIAMVKGLHLHVNTIGDLYTISNHLPTFHMPALSFDLVVKMMPNAFVIAFLAAIESLLSCVVADGMINGKHRSNTELIAQGIGNIGSALFGGIPATGAIARTAANIKSGGRTPIAGIVHSITLILILVVLMPFAAWIPMPCIAAILFIVAYNMCQWRAFVKVCKKAPKSDIFVLWMTFILTVAFDLVVAIEFSMVVACLLFMKRMSDETDVHGWRYKDEDDDLSDELLDVPAHTRVYEISGPLFFGVLDAMEDIKVFENTKCLIIRMRAVPAVDVSALTALREIYEDATAHHVRFILSHVNEQPYHALEKAGLVEMFGKENFKNHIEEALATARTIQ